MSLLGGNAADPVGADPVVVETHNALKQVNPALQVPLP
jgi:hypothetical protein